MNKLLHNANRLAIRWTIGNVRDRGFEMLRLSIACASHIFGPAAKYIVCVNTIAIEEARKKTCSLPVHVEWRNINHNHLPNVLLPYFDGGLIEGMGWKLAPLRTHPECYELALDNDCILWDLPSAMRHWLHSENGCLFAEDVDRGFGSFDALCPPGNLNAGIRGLPPNVDLADELQAVLHEVKTRQNGNFRLESEIEEQGLQAAAICRRNPLFLVKSSEVSICSPFWPRSPELGTCGAHLVGMNAHHIPWNYYDRSADEWLEEHWQTTRPLLYQKANLPIPQKR